MGISSADWMPRNLDRRVEAAVPIEDERLRAELLDVLELCFADNVNAWELGSDGVWTRLVAPEGERHSVQSELRERHSALTAEQFVAATG